jgi:tetratricopeptide (TPR) repeat protein
MNKVVKVLGILASGYLHQSFYHCETAALELQKLDDQQYNSPRVLCILGKAYYDAGDHHSARILYRHAFSIAPWYCEGTTYYSTCLWYLEQEQELNILAYVLKDNRSHLFEAYIAAGNWTKCAKGGNEATRWFEKAVKLDPSQSYGHALLGYEEQERGNSLEAKKHFSKSMIVNKRSYIGWYVEQVDLLQMTHFIL